MSTEIHCDEGCAHRLPAIDPDQPGFITQHTAAPIARASRWIVMHGATRDYHFCPVHRSSVAIVLRFAAVEIKGGPRGIHAALRELGISEVADVARAVWTVFKAEDGDPSQSHRAVLLAAARRAEAGAQ